MSITLAIDSTATWPLWQTITDTLLALVPSAREDVVHKNVAYELMFVSGPIVVLAFIPSVIAMAPLKYHRSKSLGWSLSEPEAEVNR